MSATPCNRNAEESFPVLSLKSREQEPPNPLLIRDKAFYRLAPDRRLSIEDADMRHGRKSSAKTFNGFKAPVVLDLDSPVTHEGVVCPANHPEHEAVELLAEELEKGAGLFQLDIDLG